MKLIVKKWINGAFKKVHEVDINEVQQIQHYKESFKIVLNGHILDFDSQCVIEFEKS